MRRAILGAAAALGACVQQAPAPAAPGPSISVAFLAPPPGAQLSALGAQEDGGLVVIAVAQSPGSPIVSQALVAGATPLGVVDGGVAEWRIGLAPGTDVLTVTAINAAGDMATASRQVQIDP